MSLLASLKGQEKPATSAVNDDLIQADDPVRGAPAKAPADRPSFKPIAAFSAELASTEDGQEIINIKPISFRPHDPALPQRTAKKPLENRVMPRDDFLDLITDDPPPSNAHPSIGRPRVFANNAERQKAYRERQKLKGR